MKNLFSALVLIFTLYLHPSNIKDAQASEAVNFDKWLEKTASTNQTQNNETTIKKSIASCATLQGDLERLNCYDNIARAADLAGPLDVTAPISGTGKWKIQEEVNPIDDSKSVFLFLDADEGASKWKQSVSLLIRCKSNTTELLITWHDFLGSDSARVLTRIGTEKAIEKDWGLSTDAKATFHPQGTVAFIKSMEKHPKFLAQVTPYSESPITAIFDTEGLSNALIPLKKTCGWE